MKKNVTMKDIADKLNISTVTVSKALADKDGVSDELKLKIKELADEMGYRYNSIARDMKEGKNYNIGILIADRYIKGDAFYLKMYQSAIRKLASVNYYGIMEIITLQAERELEQPKVIADNKVDGIIILGQVSREYVSMIRGNNLPYVFLDFYDENEGEDSILSDSVYGSYVVTNYLIENGHKNIAFLGSILATSSIMDRYLGYYKALLIHNLSGRKEWIIEDRDKDGNFIEFKLPDEMPTAFVCNCDEVAYMLINQLKQKGYRVPEDISVVGFDNYIYSSLSVPQLTTFEVDVPMMSETAVEAIIQKIKKQNYVLGRKIISGNIVIRDSVYNLNK